MDLADIGFVILNTIIISIPEEAFIIYLALFILGKQEFIKLKAGNLPRFLGCVIPAAIISNILRRFLPQTNSYLMFIGIVVFFLSIVLIYKLNDAKDILRAFIGVSLSSIAVMLFQVVYAPIIIFKTGITLDDVNKSILLLFFCTMPERIMEFLLLFLLTVRKSMAAKINIFSVLSKNSLVASITIFLLVFNISFLAIMGKLIYFDNILASASFFNTVLIIALVIIFPIMNISLLIVIVYSVYYRYTIRLLLSKERINNLVNALAVYTEEKNYSKIDTLVTDLHNQVNVL